MHWKLAIFDWDGTLADSRRQAYNTSCRIFAHHGVSAPSYEEYMREMHADFAPFYHKFGIPETVTRRELNELWTSFFFSLEEHPPLRPGVRETLLACREMGLRTAIVSGNVERVILSTGAALGISELVEHIRADAVGKVEELLSTVRHFGLGPAEAFYVDDTEHGLRAAREAGLAAIGIEGGFGGREQLLRAEPLGIISELEELPAAIKAFPDVRQSVQYSS